MSHTTVPRSLAITMVLIAAVLGLCVAPEIAHADGLANLQAKWNQIAGFLFGNLIATVAALVFVYSGFQLAMKKIDWMQFLGIAAGCGIALYAREIIAWLGKAL